VPIMILHVWRFCRLLALLDIDIVDIGMSEYLGPVRTRIWFFISPTNAHVN